MSLHAPNREYALQDDDNRENYNDDAAVENEGRRSSSRRDTKRKHKRKLLVLDESGQTDADRRALRKSQRVLHVKINHMQEQTVEAIDHVRNKNNVLFERVCYTREAVLDAENVDLITEKYAKKAENLVQVSSYDPMKLVTKLRSKCRVGADDGVSHYFDWRFLGREASVCLSALPSRVSFLAGVLDSEIAVKERKARAPRQKPVQDEPVEEERPEQIKEGQQQTDADQLTATEKNLKVMKKILGKSTTAAVQAKGKPELDGIHFLFNPKSFTQTVENIFNFSFLIKRGEACIAVNDNTTGDENVPPLVIRASILSDESMPSRQAIFGLTMRDWKNICKAHELSEGALPHRTGSKQVRRDVVV